MGKHAHSSFWTTLAGKTSVLMAAAFAVGCSGVSEEPSGATGIKTELAFCSSRIIYTPSITLTGTAEFQYRAVDKIDGLKGDPVTAGIPNAEILIRDGQSNEIQCSETDDSGNFTVSVPDKSGTYTVFVRSRANNAKLKISVLESYYENKPYEISKSVTVTAGQGTAAVGTITAYARVTDSPKIEGAAFNILYQAHRVNAYIRTQIGDSGFVAPKVSAYWKMGFNPYTYFGKQDLLSFYRVGSRQLFILGGDQGDVKSADTDHFDNTIIIHEYGHFLEEMYAKSDSPGGSHMGDFIYDPRLSWSEGWANFLQGAVQNNDDPTWSYYIDTVGFQGDSVEGGNGTINIKYDMKMSGSTGMCSNDPPFDIPYCDPVTFDDEGTFREIAVSRALFKSWLGSFSGGADIPFASIWKAFSQKDSGGVPTGLASSQVSFRNVARFNEFLRQVLTTDHPTLVTGWDSVLSSEKQSTVQKEYANSLQRVADDSCSPVQLSAVIDRQPSIKERERSNLLRSHDFYEFVHDGSAKTITLRYANGSNNRDLDLIVYKNDHVLLEQADFDSMSSKQISAEVVRRSQKPWSTEQGTETVDMTGVAAGRYLIDVKAYTEGRTSGNLVGSTFYRLKITQGSTTEDLCPVH